MKRYLYIISFLIILFFGFSVNALVPYRWNVGGESVESYSSNSAVRVERTESTINLFLTNYNGGKIALESLGGYFENLNINIYLEGINKISGEDYGIDTSIYPYGKVNFFGNGTLIISAQIPLSSETYGDLLFLNPSKNEIFTSDYFFSEDGSVNENSEVLINLDENTRKELKEFLQKLDNKDSLMDIFKKAIFVIIGCIIGFLVIVVLICFFAFRKIKKQRMELGEDVNINNEPFTFNNMFKNVINSKFSKEELEELEKDEI